MQGKDDLARLEEEGQGYAEAFYVLDKDLEEPTSNMGVYAMG